LTQATVPAIIRTAMTTTPTTAAPTDQIEAVRAFNRFYTARIGALRDGLLATPHPLPEARVLFELGRRGTIDAADLRRVLDLDGGYLSRLLARLEAQDLVARERSPDDGRRQRLELTAAGRAAYETLDERSAAEIGALLDELDEGDRARLLAAMSTICEVLDGAPRSPGFVLRPPRPGDFGWVVHRHGTLYAEHGWDTGFEALVARVVADYASDNDPAREAAWIAEAGGRPVGSIFCVRNGSALVDACVAFAREAGYRRVRLWTNSSLGAARRIYQRAGFRLVGEETSEKFGQDFTEQDWELVL
jgi:DNA-binding MarR family transcriptional regulator